MVTGSLVATGSPSSHLTFRKKAMSAVSSESPRAAANLSEPSSSQSAATTAASRQSAPPAGPATPAASAAPRAAAAPPPAGAEVTRLRGAAARTAQNMEISLGVPTATSVRAIPAKLLIDNRIVINNHLQRGRGGKISFTHLIGYAVVQAIKHLPEMNNSYAE